MSSRWVSLNEAVGILGISLSTLRRRIEKGGIESKLENGRRLVRVSDETHVSFNATQSAFVEQLRGENENLRQQIQEKDKQIEKLQEQLEKTNEALAEASHRHDTVVMQMTKLLEYQQQPFWRKLFFRKALPAPIDKTIMDMETGDEKKTNGK